LKEIDEETGEETATEEVEEVWRGLSVNVTHCWKQEAPDDPKTKVKRELELKTVVVTSTQLEKAKRKTLKRKFEKEEQALAALDKRFANQKHDFGCEKDAQEAAKLAIKGKQRFHSSEFSIVEEQRQEKRSRRGRPKKDEQATYRKVYKVTWTHTGHPDRLEAEIHRESCFILVTLPSSEASNTDLLDLYKGQTGIESAFKWTKVTAEIAPIFLNSPERIAALGLVYVFSLMVYALIQRQIRAALKKRQKTIPSNRGRTSKPTTQVLFRLLEGITSIPVRAACGTEFFLLEQVTTEQAAVLEYLGCDLLTQDYVRARVTKPRRGQRGYKPPPPEEDTRKRPRPRRKKCRRVKSERHRRKVSG